MGASIGASLGDLEGTPQGARSVMMSEKVLFMVAGPMAVVLAIAAPFISSF
jgi:hypothetical protein